jgi:hypothetical protein
MFHNPTPSARAPFAGFCVLTFLLLTGCSISPLAKPTAAFSSATNLVVDNSENAYRAAVRLHDQQQLAAAAATYDTNPNWDPHNLPVKHLLDDKDLDARTQVLDGLKLYAQSLSDLTNKISSDTLDNAASSVGKNLKTLSGDLPKAGFKLSQDETSGASTAVDALGTYLVSKKVASQVPTIIKNMAPTVDAICNLLNSDITVLRRQSHDDYEQLLTQQDSFIRHVQGLTPVERRAEINKLPQIIADQETTDDTLSDLQKTITKLAQTHQALAAAAQTKNPESVKARIADLEATAERLSKFYSSQSTSSSTSTSSTSSTK